MQDNKSLAYILIIICIIWIIFSIALYDVRSINVFISNIIINPVGIILLLKFIKNNKCKLFIAIYFFVYGFVYFWYDTYVMLYVRNIKEIDTLYLLSNYVMMYIPCKMYNISYKDILKKLYMK